MLRLMREHASSWLIKIILGAIVIVFVFWGVGSFRQEKADRIAFVNEEPITAEQYREAYNRLVERYRQFGAKLNEDMIKRLEKQAMDGLIDQSVMRQEAKKLNLRITDTELSKSIRKMDVFQYEGAFSNRLYRNLLNNNRLTPESFEHMQRESMLGEKLKSFILSNVKVSDQEAREWFKWNDASVSIEYVLFERTKYKDIEPTDEEVKAYYEEKKDSYKTSPTVKAQFLHFKPGAHTSGIDIPEEDVKEYYEANPGEFKTEKTVQARHILLKVDKGAKPEVEAEKKKAILDILEKAKAGEDFAELAKTHSEDEGSKVKGGDLGEFNRKRMIKPFSDKAFSMSPGEISDPVRTQFGWHIIKVEKVNEEKIASLEESKEKITKKLAENRGKDIAYDEAEKFYYSVSDGDDLAEAAKAAGLEIKTTDFFTKSGPRKGVKDRSKFASIAFELSPMQISEIKNFGDGYYIFQPIEKKPEEIEPFDKVEKRARRNLIRKKQEEMGEKEANDFLAAVKESGSLLGEAEKAELTLKTTDFFKRNASSIPDIGYEREIPKIAFTLSDEKKVPKEVIKGIKGYYVIAFKERKEPESEEFDKEKEKVKERLIQQKQFKTFNAWLSQAKDAIEITITADFLN